MWWDRIETEENRLYDLRTDPAEQRNLAASSPCQLSRLRQLLEAMWKSSKEIHSYLEGANEGSFDPELVERLKSLGYIR